tara:strand:+ start:1562 stop:1984 length:423 start_codon:yes stop_codon:yes gene_type:complete
MNQLTKIVIMSFLLIFISCEDNKADEEPLPEFGSISGAVNFIGTFPDTGEALITLDTQWPVAGPPAGFAYITSSDVQNGVYNYTFSNLSFRDYEAVTITYWPEGYVTAGSNYDLIGSYIETISVTQNNADHTINIEATFN